MIIACAMIAWGLADTSRVWEYPFLLGTTACLVLGPQIIGVLRNPDLVVRLVREDNGIERALVMYVLCLVMGLAGYRLGAGGKSSKGVSSVQLDDARLFIGGCVLTGAGYAGYVGLSMLYGSLLGPFMEESEHVEWRGPAVMFNFFMRLIYPGLACCILSAFDRSTKIKWAIVALGCSAPLAGAVFAAKRGNAAALILLWGTLLYFGRRIKPPRWTVFAGLLFLLFGVGFFAEYRSYSKLGADKSDATVEHVSEPLVDQLGGRASSEFVNAVTIMSAYNTEFSFAWGKGFYNTVIRNFVPRLLVGGEVKRSLYVDTPDQDRLTGNYYGWRRKSYSYVTGPCDAFRELWYAGSLLFLVVGMVFRRMWESAVYGGDERTQVFYCCFVPQAMFVMASSVTIMISSAAYLFLSLLPVWMFARRRLTSVDVN